MSFQHSISFLMLSWSSDRGSYELQISQLVYFRSDAKCASADKRYLKEISGFLLEPGRTVADTFYHSLKPVSKVEYSQAVRIPGLEVTLLPFQERAVQWMLKREQGFSGTDKPNDNCKLAAPWFRMKDQLDQDMVINLATFEAKREAKASDIVQLPEGGILAEVRISVL
jgi:hypothetical protein